VRPIGDRPVMLLGVLLIVVGFHDLGLGPRAELVVRGRAARDAPRLIAGVVTGELISAGERGHADSVSGPAP
jgi:hypothetical protein